MNLKIIISKLNLEILKQMIQMLCLAVVVIYIRRKYKSMISIIDVNKPTTIVKHRNNLPLPKG